MSEFITRVNLIPNPSYTYDLALWSAFGGASITQVNVFGDMRMRITYPTGGAAAAGAQITINIDPDDVGLPHRLWFSCPANSGTTTTQFSILGISAGAAFSANDVLFKQGTYDFTPTGTSHVVRIRCASASTAGDYIEVADGCCEVKQPEMLDYATFDGDDPGGQWDGAPGRSTSRFINYIPDPDVNGNHPPIPMVIVEFDARLPGPGDFILDSSSLDGSDFLIGSPRWTPAHGGGGVIVEQVAVRRGRQTEDQDIQPSICTLIMSDPDGVWDPDNPSSPYTATLLGPLLRSRMRVRVGVIVNTVGVLLYYPLFTGSLDDDDTDRAWQTDQLTLTAVDDLFLFNGSDIQPMTPPPGGSIAGYWVAWWAMAQAGKTGGIADIDLPVQMRDVFFPTGGGNVGSLLRMIAAGEGGHLFIQPDGRAKITSHADDYAVSPVAVFTDTPSAASDIEYEGIASTPSLRFLVNFATVERQGVALDGGQVDNVYGSDNDSIRLNGKHSETVTTALANDSDAAALANWRATRRSKAATRITSVSCQLAGQPDTWQNLASGIDIAKSVRIHRQLPGRVVDQIFMVEGIDHDLSRTAGWRLAVYTSPVDALGLYGDQGRPFTLDTSSLDGPDILIAY